MDEESFKRQFLPLHPRLFRVAYALTENTQDAKDEIQQIERLINQLPEKQRQVIRLRGFNDFSLDEIEKITGLSSANVRVLLSRARKMIREQFEKIACYE